MPLNKEQMDFIKSRAQDWEDSKGNTSARTKFWDRFRREWAERWLLRSETDKTFSRHFRDEMRKRRAIARGTVPKPATPRMSAPAFSELERGRALKRARGAPSSSPEDFSTPDHSPSRSQSPGHDDSPTSPTAGGPHQPTPLAGVSSAVASSSQTPAALPPVNVLMKDLMKAIAIYLELPGMTHDDVDLVFQGRTVTVSAQNNEATYEWSTDLGGPVVIDSVRAGLADDQFRAVMTINYMAEVDNSKSTNIPISDKCPW